MPGFQRKLWARNCWPATINSWDLTVRLTRRRRRGGAGCLVLSPCLFQTRCLPTCCLKCLFQKTLLPCPVPRTKKTQTPRWHGQLAYWQCAFHLALSSWCAKYLDQKVSANATSPWLQHTKQLKKPRAAFMTTPAIWWSSHWNGARTGKHVVCFCFLPASFVFDAFDPMISCPGPSTLSTLSMNPPDPAACLLAGIRSCAKIGSDSLGSRQVPFQCPHRCFLSQPLRSHFAPARWEVAACAHKCGWIHLYVAFRLQAPDQAHVQIWLFVFPPWNDWVSQSQHLPRA